ncbi:hypothetical protein ACFQY7_29715 [Actinomadura luteofluorescens]|uniref:hypothetical protein n=1 Tax=Actinomadura luteofluorescens TaxID=46163 RepID=UPI003645449F
MPNSASGSRTQSDWHQSFQERARARSAVVLPVPGGPCRSSSRPETSSRVSFITESSASATGAV